MRIALVSPMLLPISKSGGAVEQLILSLVLENEKAKHPLNIDLYTIYQDDVNQNYKYTNVISVKKSYIGLFKQKCFNLFYKIIRSPKRYNYIHDKTAKELKKSTYDKVIIENSMMLYRAIYDGTNTMIYHMHNDFDTFDKTPDNYMFIESTCETILTISGYIKNRLLEVKKSDKIKVFYNCIDLNKFVIDSLDKVNALKEKYGIQNNYVIGYTGRITDEKGVYELVCAFKKVLSKHPNYKLLIVGSSWFNAKTYTAYEKKIIDVTSDIKDAVIFTGYVNYDDMKYYYKMMDVVVIPSKWNEPFGLVALEALAMNLKVISTPNGALKEALLDNAFYVSCDIDSIFNALDVIENTKIDISFDPHIHSSEHYYTEFVDLIGGIL